MTVGDERTALMTAPAAEPVVLGAAADAGNVHAAAGELARGRAVVHRFGTVRALTCRPGREDVARARLLAGRPEGREGGVTTAPDALAGLFDWTRLPAELPRRPLRQLMEELAELGPFGFRGPAADRVPEHLTSVRDGVRTVRAVTPGLACPSHAFLAAALDRTGAGLLFTLGVEGAPERADEAAARRRFPHHAPVPVTVLAFHRAVGYGRAGLPALALERPGSLSVEHLRSVAANHGFALAPAPAGAPAAGAARVYAPSVRR
ncbi:hypothetical protein AB6O49_11595 [Streptomyces sp. SBR177]